METKGGALGKGSSHEREPKEKDHITTRGGQRVGEAREAKSPKRLMIPGETFRGT